MARQRLGQHFLVDAGWREKIARVIGASAHSTGGPRFLGENACWIEVGAGHGEMTQHLVATGAPVYAVELDEPLINRLGDLAAKFPNLTVIPGDILQTDLAAIAAGRRIRLYGNLPYYITSPILHHFFGFADLIDQIHIVVQMEVAFRLAARPGTRDYGYLSVLTQYFSRPELAMKIPRGAFRPPPEVGSALVTLRLPGEHVGIHFSANASSNEGTVAIADKLTSNSEESRFLDFVKLCFSQKRKTLVNNLRSLSSPEQVREILVALQLRPDARAEQLSVKHLAAIFSQLHA